VRVTAPGEGAEIDQQVEARRRLLTWLTIVLAIPAPLGIVAALFPQLRASGDVSHWPWEEHGFFGWWLIPLCFAIAAACSAARTPGRRSTVTRALLALAVASALALFYNP